MNLTQTIKRSVLIIGLFGCLFTPPRTAGADANPPVPGIIQNGFKAWKGKDASYALDIWKKGGLLETDAKPTALARFFSSLDHAIGNYKSYDAIESKNIGPSSRIIYLSINFEQAVVYGRFLAYRTDGGWIVQNMDFSLKPEAVMPWLAFTGVDYSQ